MGLTHPQPAPLAQISEWHDDLAAQHARITPRFDRPEVRSHVADYVRGLLADIDRKNGWQLAEHADYAHPRGIQRVLDRSPGMPRPSATICGATSWERWAIRTASSWWMKRGFPSRARAPWASPASTAARWARSAIARLGSSSATPGPRVTPRSTGRSTSRRRGGGDPARCHRAGIPAATPFRTKPQLALTMLERALDGGVPAAWVVTDEVYGSDGALRRALEGRGQTYVLAACGNQPVSTWPPYGPPN